jgi:hypothetical protein
MGAAWLRPGACHAYRKPTPIGDHVITIRELTVADIRALLVESMQQHGDVGLIPEQADLVLNATCCRICDWTSCAPWHRWSLSCWIAWPTLNCSCCATSAGS